MKLWIDFYDYYLTDLPGCTSFAAANELRRAAQEFCDRTKVWRVELDPTVTNAREDTYDFEIEEDQLLVKVMSAKLDTKDLNIVLPGEDGDGSMSMLVLDQTQFKLLQQPAARQQVVVTAVMKPSNIAVGVDDYVFDHYAEMIAFGAKARLMDKPGKPYTSPALAMQNKDRFESAIGKVLLKAAKGYSSAPLRTNASFL